MSENTTTAVNETANNPSNYWKNYFVRDDFVEYIPTNLSAYQAIEKNADEFADLTAISFYGLKITYKTMFERIDQLARALRASGVGKDDVVAGSLPSIPEGVILIYAINKIGARYCAFDCRSKEGEILETLEKFNPKICVIPDFQMDAFKNVKDCTVVHVSPVNFVGKYAISYTLSSNFFTGRYFLKMRKKNFISYNKFLERAAQVESAPTEISTDNIFGYFYTSGTTYGRKSIILTNENINAACIQYAGGFENARPTEKMLTIMPMFTCYGVSIAVHLPLMLGLRISMIPLIDIKKMKETLEKNKPNYIITVPAHWEYFVKEDFTDCDLSYLTTVIVGGDKIDPEYEDRINQVFKDCGSTAKLRPGYGLSETTSSGSFPYEDSPKGSVGSPMKYTLLGIFDPETYEPLPPNTDGEICIWGPTVCKGYYKDEEMTEKLLRKHDSDGKVWLHSGDIGYLDEKGNLFFRERIKRMYVRHDGTKISPYSIEQVISQCPIVARCMVTAIPDVRHTHGKVGKALIVLREGVNKSSAYSQLEQYMNKNLGLHMIPKETVIVDKLPYTKNGKLDYFAAMQVTEEK